MSKKELAENCKKSDYKTWLYKMVDGQLISAIFKASEAEAAWEEGYRLTPAHEDLTGRSEPSEADPLINDVAGKMNLMLNYQELTEKQPLIELGEFLGLKLTKRQTLKAIKYQLAQVIDAMDQDNEINK